MSTYIQLPLDGSGKQVECDIVEGLYRQAVTSHPANSFGDITADAWGVPKVSIPYSLFHGLFTFDVPANQWFMYHDQTQVYTSSNITSIDGAAVVQANATQPSVKLESRATPRYQPNRGHLYSTAAWFPNATADAFRDFGLSTIENGVYFRLKSTGLYAVLKSGITETREDLIDTSSIAGFDVTKGNVYDIQYQWRGVGNYNFYINLQLVHTFANLGTLTTLSTQDPALPAFFRVVKVADDAAIYVGCVDISSENGSDNDTQPRVAYANISKNGTNVPVITIYNPLTINGKTNTRIVHPTHLTFSCDKKAVFKVWLHRDPALLTGETLAALGGGSYVQTDSPDTVSTSVAATAANTATMTLLDVINVQPAGTGAFQVDSQLLNTTLVRGDYLTVTVTTITGLCDVVVAWGESV